MTAFRYFAAPESEMLDLLPGLRRCDLCGDEGRCFSLERALMRTAERAAFGCMPCLHAGRFGFFHVTQVGYLDQSGLAWYGEEPKAAVRVFVASPSGELAEVPAEPTALVPDSPPAEALEELRRTPDFPTWNEVPWPVHCSDFMSYLGPWQPKDIKRHAAARGTSGEALLRAMLGEDHHVPWPDDREEWGITFHAFRCTTCAALVGWLDLD